MPKKFHPRSFHTDVFIWPHTEAFPSPLMSDERKLAISKHPSRNALRNQIFTKEQNFSTPHLSRLKKTPEKSHQFMLSRIQSRTRYCDAKYFPISYLFRALGYCLHIVGIH